MENSEIFFSRSRDCHGGLSLVEASSLFSSSLPSLLASDWPRHLAHGGTECQRLSNVTEWHRFLLTPPPIARDSSSGTDGCRCRKSSWSPEAIVVAESRLCRRRSSSSPEVLFITRSPLCRRKSSLSFGGLSYCHTFALLVGHQRPLLLKSSISSSSSFLS